MVKINYITDEISYIIKKSIIKLFPSLNDEHVKLILKYIAIFHTLHESEIELALFTNQLFNLL